MRLTPIAINIRVAVIGMVRAPKRKSYNKTSSGDRCFISTHFFKVAEYLPQRMVNLEYLTEYVAGAAHQLRHALGRQNRRDFAHEQHPGIVQPYIFYWQSFSQGRQRLSLLLPGQISPGSRGWSMPAADQTGAISSGALWHTFSGHMLLPWLPAPAFAN